MDEASMAKRQAFECFDRMLQDITDWGLPFGGKIIVFGGEFHQIPPVVLGNSKEDTIDASFVKSSLWSVIVVIFVAGFILRT
ncbi:hypothetical protein QJS10_CPB04g01296 [Acorus calamus]|uniref:ATP-dependent DNA helicase n=1 Tax=Acorus calamus TaxID=4465 RepID=A0AAV9EYL5_ACOCL|nr:hypothetical protein QJS10_CPB04g01296 [Acorus calamus]